MYIKRQIEHKLTVSLWYNYMYDYFGSGYAKPNCMMIFFFKNQQQQKVKNKHNGITVMNQLKIR